MREISRGFFHAFLVRVRTSSFHRARIHKRGVSAMPRRGPVPCKEPGCPELIPYGEKYCAKHKALHVGDRKSASSRGYNSGWRKMRARFLQQPENVFCVECMKRGVLTRATVVDHIIPHRGDQELFWDQSNWQALCKSCHDRKTRTKDQTPTYKY